MVWVAAAVVISVLVGLFSERARPEAASDLARRALSFLLYFFFPPIVFVNLAETEFGFGMGAGLIAGLVACYRGLMISGGGAKAVGNAVNETVVYAFMALFVVNVVVTAIGIQMTTG